MRIIGKILYIFEEFILKSFYKLFRESAIKSSLGSCGKNVHISKNTDIKGIKNIFIGNDVSLGFGAVLWTTKAKIYIEDKVIVGPGLTIITGDHKIDTIGKYMADITETEKDPENDQDVIIKKDVWIGSNVTILKGVTIAEGCVIGGGTVLTKSTEPYGVYVGVSGKLIKKRFSEEKLVEHKKILNIKL